MLELGEFYLRLTEHRMDMRDEQVALLLPPRLRIITNGSDLQGELMALIAAPELGMLLANRPISRLGKQFVVTVS